METPISHHGEEKIDVEADILATEQEETEDEELIFDADKDMWVSVRVERSGRDSVSERSYWVWEVERRAIRVTDSPLNTYCRWEKMRRGAISLQGEQCFVQIDVQCASWCVQ